jgi:hypothetical protein
MVFFLTVYVDWFYGLILSGLWRIHRVNKGGQPIKSY